MSINLWKFPLGHYPSNYKQEMGDVVQKY